METDRIDTHNVFQEHWIRFKRPWCISFTIYFIFIIVILGGLGVIISIFDSRSDLNVIALNLGTYSFAVLVPAVISVLLSFLELKNKVSAILLCVASILLCVFLLFLSSYGYVLAASLSTIIAWFFWVISNSENELLNDISFDKSISKNVRRHEESWD